jgi:hypothetical protein
VSVSFEDMMYSRNEQDFWVLNGDSSSYDLKEEIKAWGGYWDYGKRRWRIDCINKGEPAFLVLTKRGLILREIKKEGEK